MKLNINKASDLSSISVLPPHARRSNNIPAGPESSVFGKIQAYQLRSQPSQQSLSQGVSSQHGMFSQLSQNSIDDIVTNDQRFGSQERENSVKKICLPTISYTREESQMPISRSSSNLMCKWNSASVSDHRRQISEEFEHRIGMMETSLNRFGIILDSVQSDIMQVNKGMKEVSMVVEDIQHKLVVHNNLMQQMNKGQEDIITGLDGGLKAISAQFCQDKYQEMLQEVSLALSDLPGKVDACSQKLKFDLCKTFTQDLQALACRWKIPNQKHLTPISLPSKVNSYQATQQQLPHPKNPMEHPKLCGEVNLLPKIEMGSWTSVKQKQSNFRCSTLNEENKQKGVSPIELEREWIVVIESDEEIDGAFSCLLEEKKTDIEYSAMAKAKEETERILRRARRRKRKYH